MHINSTSSKMSDGPLVCPGLILEDSAPDFVFPEKHSAGRSHRLPRSQMALPGETAVATQNIKTFVKYTAGSLCVARGPPGALPCSGGMAGYNAGTTSAEREVRLPRVTGVKNRQAASKQVRSRTGWGEEGSRSREVVLSMRFGG